MIKDDRDYRDEQLYNDYRKGVPVHTLSVKYKLSESNIFARLRKVNPSYQLKNSYKRWNKKETLFLIDNYETLSIKAIAKKLKKSPRSISNKAWLLGLVKYNNPVQEVQILHTQGFNTKEIANKLNLSNIRIAQILRAIKQSNIKGVKDV